MNITGATWRSPAILHDEIITEILSRLPVKSLLRFRCVCKSWKSLIYSSSFVKLHLQRLPKNAKVLLTYGSFCGDTRAVSCKVPSLLQNSSLELAQNDYIVDLKMDYLVVGSCNGLFCLRNIRFVSDTFTLDWVCFLNPTMRVKSQDSPRLRVNTLGSHISCARFGFGYDDYSDSYKAVVVILGLKKTRVKVHTVGDSCWRKILSLPVFPILGQTDGQFVSRTVNWLALESSGFDYSWDSVTVNQLVIFSLHVGKETYRHLLLPEGFDEVPRYEPGLTVLRDSLCLFHNYRGTNFLLWQMKEFGVAKSWFQLVNLPCDCYPVIPICLSDDGDDVVLSNNENNESILYSVRDNRVLQTQEHYAEIWLDAEVYVESLVLPC